MLSVHRYCPLLQFFLCSYYQERLFYGRLSGIQAFAVFIVSSSSVSLSHRYRTWDVNLLIGDGLPGDPLTSAFYPVVVFYDTFLLEREVSLMRGVAILNHVYKDKNYHVVWNLLIQQTHSSGFFSKTHELTSPGKLAIFPVHGFISSLLSTTEFYVLVRKELWNQRQKS